MLPLSFGDPIRLGPYRLTGVLGEGGMGKVYFGLDNAGRSAAVKVLRPDLAHDQHLAQRFLREAQTAQSVTSSGIAGILGAETEGGRPWIASEYLAGPTLDQFVDAHGPLNEASTRALAWALASTLRDIHRAALIHRDLKPSNIVLTFSGPRIIDFGIARPEHGLTLTTTGQVPFTPGYGAPEQVLGQRVGPPADVFSLGAVLAYAASGRRAFEGSHVAAIQYAVVHGAPDLEAVPPALHTLISLCLSKNPAQRPQLGAIVEEFTPSRGAHRLWKQGTLAQQIKEHEARTKRFTSIAETAVDGMPSRRRFVTSLAAGATALALGGAAWWLTAGPDLPATEDAEPARLLTSDEYGDGRPPTPLWGPLNVADAEASTLLPMRDVVIFASSSGGLLAHRVTDGRKKWSLPEVSPSAGFVRLTAKQFAAADVEGNVLAFDASNSERKWTAPADAVRLLAAAPNASMVYVLTRNGQLAGVDTENRKVRWEVNAPAGLTVDPGAVATAGSGVLVVCTADGDYFALHARNGKEAWQLADHATTALTPAVEEQIVYVGGKELAALDLRTGDEIWSAPSESLNPAQDGWGSPTIGDRYLAVIDDGRLYRVDKSTGLERHIAWPDSTTPSRILPPVAEGHSLWIAEGGTSSGVSAFDDSLVWTYEPESEGPWYMAGAGHRVFLLNRGSVVALPVF